MTLLNIYNLEATGDMDVVCTFSEGEHVIGRGDTLNCNDKRVSRKHALITVAKDAVTIKSVHINPCFFKAFNGNSVTILPKETPVDLHDGDQFALLADVFWFKVKIIWQNDRNGSKSNGMKEQGSHSELDEKRVEGSPGTLRFENDASNIPSSSKRGLDEEAVVNTKRTKILPDNGNDALPSDAVIVGITENPQQVNVDCQGVNINPSKLINNLRNILEEDYGSKSEEKPKALKKENQEPDSSKEKSNLVTACNSNEVKVENTSKEKSNSATACNSNEVKVENTSKEKSNSVTACNSNEVKVENTLDKEIKVKKEKVDSEETHKQSEDTPSGSNSIENVDKIKEEQREDDSTKDKKDDATGTTQNDPSCSRDNEDKKKSRRERCWYGPSCYRKNPIHRQDFSHPGDNDYDSDPDDDRPVCPFGGACYRRNLEHRRQLKHPNPPAVKPSKAIQLNISTSCPHCPHCNNSRKQDYESDYESDYEY